MSFSKKSKSERESKRESERESERERIKESRRESQRESRKESRRESKRESNRESRKERRKEIKSKDNFDSTTSYESIIDALSVSVTAKDATKVTWQEQLKDYMILVLKYCIFAPSSIFN